MRLLRPTLYRLAEALPSSLPAGPPVTVVGYIRASKGVGEVARGSILALQRVGHPVRYIDVEPKPTLDDTDLPSNLPVWGEQGINLLHVNAANVQQTYRLMERGFFKDTINVGFWFWEMPTFPDKWYGAFSLFDEIWVGSSYTQATLAAVSPIPVLRMRNTVQPAEPAQQTRSELGLPEERFLFSFDVCSIMERKNPQAVIRAFHKAFGTPESGPLLVLKLHNSDLAAGRETELGLAAGTIAELRLAIDSVNGVLLDRRLDRATTSALMAACDCYVSLHRCEGFGLTMAEAMYFGKPCIATAYSGNMDFMTPSNSYPVGYRLVTLQRNWGPYETGDQWAEPDVDHAAALMRQVVAQPEEATARGRQGAEDIRREYNASAVGHAIQRRLQLLVLRRFSKKRFSIC
jgi:glycosyltransferase involved in cell wall biosynthesis